MDILRHCTRRIHGFRVVNGIPIQARRLACNPDVIDTHFQTPKQLLCAFPECGFSNLSETGYQEYVDGHAESVIVPSSSKGKTIHVLAS
jgi:hypothetical protein